VLEQLLTERQNNKQLKNVKVFACGPEIMQFKIAQMCEKFGVECEISLERYMKCGFGICGNCCVDDAGFTTCQAGPVVSGEASLKVAEFGKYHRDKTGVRHNF
jgi:dihydroorotate dehydrogenase electron transfer subunit